MKWFKQLICKHDYIPLANIYGDMIHATGCRTVIICKKCGKIKFVKDFIDAPLVYNAICEFTYFKKVAGEEVAWNRVKDYIFKDINQFIFLFGGRDNVQ